MKAYRPGRMGEPNGSFIPSPQNWSGGETATVTPGLPPDLLPPGAASGCVLAFIGRISPEKRADRPIEIAQKAGMHLKIAAKIENADRKYFEAQIRHLLDDPHVEYIGEINE